MLIHIDAGIVTGGVKERQHGRYSPMFPFSLHTRIYQAAFAPGLVFVQQKKQAASAFPFPMRIPGLTDYGLQLVFSFLKHHFFPMGGFVFAVSGILQFVKCACRRVVSQCQTGLISVSGAGQGGGGAEVSIGIRVQRGLQTLPGQVLNMQCDAGFILQAAALLQGIGHRGLIILGVITYHQAAVERFAGKKLQFSDTGRPPLPITGQFAAQIDFSHFTGNIQTYVSL